MANEATLSDIRSALEAERDGLRAQLAPLGSGSINGDHYDPNFADSSQVTAERGEAEALAATLRDTLVNVERALQRLEQGAFGQCELCGEPIGDARLEAMPTARRCITCASKR
jgi:DnaK suppressor protein